MMNYNSSASINPKVINVLAKQQHDLVNKPTDGVIFLPNMDGDVTEIQADIIGPVGTAYEGGIFRCKLVLDSDFPQKPPKGYFLTKIFHPNVATPSGEICVNTLKRDWNPSSWSLQHVFGIIKCLLIVPFPESSLNEEAGREFMENYDEFCSNARVFTSVHAKPDATQARMIEQHMKQLLKINYKEETKQQEGGESSTTPQNIVHQESSSQSPPSKREISVLGQVTNSFVTNTQTEMKGEILGQMDYNHEMSQNIGTKPVAKKATATTDAKKKWMRRI